jgi:PAS domain S-box-containing protein
MTEENQNAGLLERIKELEEGLAERDQRIAALKVDADRYTMLTKNTSDLIHSVTPDGRFIFVNEAWKETLGYSDAEIAELKLMDIVSPSCQGKCGVIFLDLLKGVNISRNVTVFIAKDGREVQVEGRCNTTFEGDKAVAMTGVFRDITEQEISDKALKESEERYRDLFENATDLLQVVAPDGKLLYVNRAWRETFGYSGEDIDKGLSIFDLISPDCQEHCVATFGKIVSSPGVNYLDTVFTAKDGRKVIIEGNAKCKFVDNKPVRTQCIFRDVTQHRKLEEELQKNQKIESLGILAGGIAHDFNNLLTAILGNISLAKLHVDQESKVFRYLANTEKVAERATGLTQQLLTFSKGGAPVKKTTTITDLIQDSARFILRGSNVSSEYDFSPDLHVVDVDEGQLSQVVQNLVINADQSMAAGGNLKISGRNVTLGAGVVPPLPQGEYVQLTFADQGCGIPQESIDKVFDPYFSSKSTGNGLGLAVSYSIMKKHGGAIMVNSEVGKGTVFTLYLPASEQTEQGGEQTGGSDNPLHGRILIMDDEACVREIARSMLEYLGCQVVEAANGYEAIEVYEENRIKGAPFAAVIMDLTIPGSLGGLETLGKLQGLDPEVKALVSSGYANDPAMANYRDYGFVGVIPKPFTIKELLETLTRVLSS